MYVAVLGVGVWEGSVGPVSESLIEYIVWVADIKFECSVKL